MKLIEYRGNITSEILLGLKKLGEKYDEFEEKRGLTEEFFYYIKNYKSYKIIYTIGKNKDGLFIGQMMAEPLDPIVRKENNVNKLLEDFIKTINSIEELKNLFNQNEMEAIF